MNRPEKGCGIFYTRDSGGKHEMTPVQYVEWAQRRCQELAINFDGTPPAIEEMIREECSERGDIYLDYDVKGNELSRKGLNALLERAAKDSSVSHVLIPRRDRLARPDRAIDGIKIEDTLRCCGITLVFMDSIYPPPQKGKRENIADKIVALLAYDHAGQFRRELASKILMAQIELAKSGFSTGGRPPFGFLRCLVREDGTVVRQLADGERVRMRGHHVVWMPGSEEDQALIRRILVLLEALPASRVAAMLTAEGIPSPDAARWRKDNGVRHQVSGDWHQTTIVNIARNPLLLALTAYGRRSMGDQLRYSSDGPRELAGNDYRGDEKPKIVRNNDANVMFAKATFSSIVDPVRHAALIAELDRRGKTQRGKPRSRTATKNPLGSRIFDFNCGWPMYRLPYGKTFRYTCGRYQQSHGQMCNHNHVEGVTATRFVLSCLRQRLLSTDLLPKLETRLRQFAQKEVASHSPNSNLQEKRKVLAKFDEDMALAHSNLARARSDEQYEAIAAEFDKLSEQRAKLQTQIEKLEATAPRATDTEAEVAAAMDLVRRITELAANSESLEASGEIIRLVNARLFVAFQGVKVKKRTLNKPTGGVLTFGSALPPINIYRGPTGREKIKGSALASEPGGDSIQALPPNAVFDGKGRTLGNVSRGDRI